MTPPDSRLAELRARVGAAGADLTDEQLLRLGVQVEAIAHVLVGMYRDRLDPEGAAARRELERQQHDRALAPRRRKYAREKARKATKR